MEKSRKKQARRGGILLHPTSLPGPFGIGDLGSGVDRFLDWAVSAGQSLWQILPLGPTGAGNSPYGCLSAFAGNPLLIAPDRLVDAGLLPPGALSNVPEFPPLRIEYGGVSEWKERILHASWEFFRSEGTPAVRAEVEQFSGEEENRVWLDDWALFMALKQSYGGRAWTEWERPLRLREKDALARARADLAEEIDFHKYVQFLFFRQWDRVREEARRRAVVIMGDAPIYVALDSADVWANPQLFLLDEEDRPTHVAGVPPDYFSPTGQRWGNPVYRWDRMKQNGYRWWIARMRANLRLVDLLRLDHFRGFAAYWQIPASQPTAQGGRWVEGPGLEFFERLRDALRELPFVAEDLGEITPDVDELRDAAGLPGMKVLQFAFGEDDSPHMPGNFVSNMVVYTGTHDNDTTRGWYEKLDEGARRRVAEYLGRCDEPAAWRFIRAAYTSVADVAIVPMQDVLELGSDARMNVPGRPEDNWTWRVSADEFRADDARALRRLAQLTGRLPK